MGAEKTILYDYWRSSASYRLRIALNLLNIDYQSVPVNLLKKENLSAEHLTRNPQGLVPALYIDDMMMTQSLAIIEYLHETRVNSGFLPDNPLLRQKARALADVIAMEIHPVCNLRVAAYVVELTGEEASRKKWMQKFIFDGLVAFEAMLNDLYLNNITAPSFSFGERPGIVEMCIAPQVYNAERWEVDLTAMPRLMQIYDNCQRHPAFIKAYPQNPEQSAT